MKRQKSFQIKGSTLYLVATPIGNLEDMTFRAVRILKEVDYIYCEDTRTSAVLLNHYEIETKMRSFHLFNENTVSKEIISILALGQSVAIISDAGLPVISDPGWVVVHDAIQEDIPVVVIPGATAGLSALVASGLNSTKFHFVGFLNSKTGKRKIELDKLKHNEDTLIMYESPHRIEETLKMIRDSFGDRQICLARELTKKHEEFIRGTASEILDCVSEIKGEIVLVISGCESGHDADLQKLSIKDHYNYYLALEYDQKTAMKMVAVDRNISKKIIYDHLFKDDKEN